MNAADVIDRRGDLAPPVVATLQVGEVLPQRRPVLVAKATAQPGGELLAVGPGVGDENARRGRDCHGELFNRVSRTLLAMAGRGRTKRRRSGAGSAELR
jgi:hypothetical protein